MAEGVALRGKLLVGRAVVDGAQYAIVERYGVHRHVARLKVGFVFRQEHGVDFAYGYVAAVAEGGETVERRGVGFDATHLVLLTKLADYSFHEIEEHGRRFRLPEARHYAVGREEGGIVAHGVDNVGNAGGVVAEFLVYEHYRARARGVNGHCFGLCGVPFFGIYLAAAYDVARDIAAGYAVNYTARTACHRRGAELDS